MVHGPKKSCGKKEGRRERRTEGIHSQRMQENCRNASGRLDKLIVKGDTIS